MNRQHAFTLVELMVTLAVLGISLMIAVPSYLSFSRSNRSVSETNALVGALNFARSEATTLRSSVSICTSSDGLTCTAGIGWKSGWIVFVDNDPPAQVDAGDSILRVYGPLSPANNISASAAMTNYLTYGANGFSNAQGQFVLCDDSGAAKARTISVSRTGRVSLETGGGTCSAS
jgi:type IV fimbrial biogenesis protein FimT